MTTTTAMVNRMKRELKLLDTQPPFGVSAWPKDDRLDVLEACTFGEACVRLLKHVYTCSFVRRKCGFEFHLTHTIDLIQWNPLRLAPSVCHCTIEHCPSNSSSIATPPARSHRSRRHSLRERPLPSSREHSHSLSI